ncbi:MAG: RpoL/Rpb11 RNA polymerase subunit family protein [Candidatus Micrarchaeota archaeon]
MKIILNEKNELHVSLEGFDLGFANYLVEKLLQDKEVDFAAADYDHPTSRNPIIKIKAASAKKKLQDALKEVEEELKALEKALK